MKIDILNTENKKVGSMEVPDAVFAQEYNESLIHQVVVAQLANKRQGTKSTLTRSEVRGGGAKPWRQKGTGRARQGSSRSPQWIKGGVVFAPKPRDFSKKVNKKMKTAAMRSALSQKLRDGGIIVLDKFEIAEPKTKLVASFLDKINPNKTTLLVLQGEQKDVLRAGKNIESLKIEDASLLSLYDLVASGKCVITKEAVETLAEVYAQ
ncbi:MAG: 50S ribosomal protein L4 [Firmicutes bacterium]|nr:50S ribosomal protein L4 [Bacillota bacterium]